MLLIIDLNAVLIYMFLLTHPLQKAGPHPLWVLQATLEISEEDPKQKNQDKRKQKLDENKKTGKGGEFLRSW